jgi:nucleoside-diphosphate-sugar epimerase
MIRFASNLARGRAIEVHRGSARGWLHISDAVRAVEAATRVERYATINIGHPEIVPIVALAEMIRVELQADRNLVRTVDLPGQMTLIKRPTLERQRTLLRFEPTVSLADGVRRVCAFQSRLVAAERACLPLAVREMSSGSPLETGVASIHPLELPVADAT